ncbi:helix-turn-helix domain-containing protein [Lysinibacillus xylanilyticus]|uniref:helix-turn-helix domain-containing protein n=1 Tax=Lysinibacillus xylanilyticus TaxID=582475 RepID=UPI0037F8F565
MFEIKLKEILDKKNMSIAKLHELTGISQNTLGLIANGKNKGIQFETLDKIIDALNIELNDILVHYENHNYIYSIAINNDYSALKENEKRLFRYQFLNLTEDGEEQFLYDLSFYVHYFYSKGNTSIPFPKFNLFISYFDKDLARYSENLNLSQKLNHLFEDRSGLTLMSYLIVDDILSNFEFNEKIISAIVDLNGFERDNPGHLSIQVPISLDNKNSKDTKISELLTAEKINLPAYRNLIESFSNIKEVLFINNVPHIKVLY